MSWIEYKEVISMPGKVIEMCPFCMEEVELDPIPMERQPCPRCGALIRPCCLCAIGDTVDCTCKD